MRRAVLAFLGTAASLVMLLSFKTHSTSIATPPAAIGAPNPTTPTSTPSSATHTSRTGSTSSSSATSSSASATKTVSGDAADTRYGPIQVRITVTKGKLTNAIATEYPAQDPRDYQINSYAIPQLNQEAVAAGSAHIDVVSGATYTSDGYAQSLQSALDKAGL
jgi:uncharacterized protein with FMN-binding domain